MSELIGQSCWYCLFCVEFLDVKVNMHIFEKKMIFAEFFITYQIDPGKTSSFSQISKICMLILNQNIE